MAFSKWREEKTQHKIAVQQAKQQEMVNGLVAQLSSGEEIRCILMNVATKRGSTPYSGSLAVTNHRLIFRGNFINQWFVDSHPLDRTTGVSVKNGALLSKLAVKNGVNFVEYDCNPVELAEFMNYVQQGANVSAESPPAVTPAASAADELERLADLHSKGILSDQEFTLAKQRIIDKL